MIMNRRTVDTPPNMRLVYKNLVAGTAQYAYWFMSLLTLYDYSDS